MVVIYKYIGDSYKRGCVYDLDYEFQRLCSDQSDTCKSCFGKNCNEKPNYQKCYVCNGEDSLDCTEITSQKYSSFCEEFSSSCITGVDESGYIHRRCIRNTTIADDNTEINEFSKGFEVCTESDCNRKIFPSDRLLCHQCNGEDSCSFSELFKNSISQHRPQLCNICSSHQQCFANISEGNRNV